MRTGFLALAPSGVARAAHGQPAEGTRSLPPAAILAVLRVFEYAIDVPFEVRMQLDRDGLRVGR